MSKVVLITGASSGMGKATAIFFASQGFTVYAGSRTPEKLSDIKNIHPIFLDITDFKNIQKAADEIGHINILINNAGYGLVSSVEEVTEEQMQAQFDVNIFGLLRVCKAVIPMMREQAEMILKIIKDENFKARETVGDKAKKFIPMKKELSDEDFERRVREHYNLG